MSDAVERAALRAAALLGRPGAWLEQGGDAYLVRLGPDRRTRPAMRIDEAAFRALVQAPGLKPLRQGGWSALPVRGDSAAAPPPPGRPGVELGERTVIEADGRPVRRTVNLGESPVMLLLRRGWLTPAEAAAGERLREDWTRAGLLGRLTMSWDNGPRGSGGRGPDPAERARAAKARVAEALAAAGPGLREVLERVCLSGTAMEAAERDLGLPRRSGKALLKLALQRAATVYGVG